jgi:hypothetical protein
MLAMNATPELVEQLGRIGMAVEGVTSFTIIYHCITMQYRAKCRAGAACGGSNQCAYQPSPVLTGFPCSYKLDPQEIHKSEYKREYIISVMDIHNRISSIYW